MDKLDQNHPGAYGLSVFNPEVGYLKCTLSNRLAGFERTAAFQQFVADMDAYAHNEEPESERYRFTSTERNAHAPQTPQEVWASKHQGAHTRDCLRTVFAAIGSMPNYEHTWKANQLTLQRMGEELSALTNLSAASMWKLVFGTSASRHKFQSAADLLLVVRLLDSIAYVQNEPDLPIHPQEYFRPLAVALPPTQTARRQEEASEAETSDGTYNTDISSGSEYAYRRIPSRLSFVPESRSYSDVG